MTCHHAQKSVRKLRKSSRAGSAVLESVLVMMLLVSAVFGIVEFGWYFYVRHSFEGAAREGVRAGIVTGAANSDVTTAVNNYINAACLSSSGYTTTIQSPLGTSCSVSNITAGTSFYVTVSATWSVAGSGFCPLQLISPNKLVSSVAEMRHE